MSHRTQDIATLAGSAVLICLGLAVAHFFPDALMALAHQ
jgi:hypothetical protein